MMHIASEQPVAIKVGKYFGAYVVRNVALETIPAKFPSPTKTPVTAAR
jgi:hypothetical protein